MGKNSKRHKGTWTPHPVDGSSETTSGPVGHTDDDGFLDDSRLMKGKRRVEKDASLKRKKKTKKRKDTMNNQAANNTAALRQLLGDSFPRRRRSLHFSHLHNDEDGQEDGQEDDEEEEEERFADLSDIVATDWRAEARMPPEGSDSSASVMEENDEEIYQSRKLVMRQLVMNQLSFIRQHFSAHQEVDVGDEDDERADDVGERQLDRDGGASDVDSWAEMEERFAEIYQPIPYDVAMDSWRSMTKEQMLRTVTSRRLRSRMKYMSRAEILGQIQTLKLAQDGDARRKSKSKSKSKSESESKSKSKSPVYEDMSNAIGAQPTGNRQAAELKKKKRVKTTKAQQQQQQHCQTAPLYQNTSSYQGLSLADIYQAKVEARRQELQQMKHQKPSIRPTGPMSPSAGHNDVYVTTAMVHAPPISDDDDDDEDDEDDEDRQRFVSRSSILNKWGTPSTAQEVKSKTELIAQFWRQSDYITTEYSRSLGGGGGQPQPQQQQQQQQQQQKKVPPAHSCSSSSPSSSASCPSDCDCYCDGGDACSVCSCSSCGSFKTVRSVKKAVIVTQPAKLEQQQQQQQQRVDAEVMEKVGGGTSEPIENRSKTPEPVPLSLVKQRKMEFERLRVLEEQENRLQELVRRTRSDAATVAPAAHRSWLDLAQRARQLEDKWNSARRSASSAAHAIYEPVPASQLLLKKDDHDKGGRSKNPNRSKKRSKVIKQLKSRMRENLESESLDPRVRQRRHQELQELLSDAVHAGTQTLTNINLGLIYVPMERQLEHVKGKEPSSKIVGPPGGGLMTLKRDRSQLGGSAGGSSSGGGGGGGGGANSANSAIVAECLAIGEAGRSTDESEDVFGSIDTLIFEPKAGGSSAATKAQELEEVEERIAKQFDYLNDYGSCHEGESSDDVTSKTTADSKNGRRAAAAAVAAASPPRNKNNVIAGPAGSASCAAAASCDAFASERPSDDAPDCHGDDDSLASFKSANCQGLHVLKDIHVRVRERNERDDDDNGRMDSSRASASKSEKKSTASTMDSENYTNVDTDASWDYYPDGLADAESPADWLKSTGKSGQQQQHQQHQPNSFLAVGNLRKKPPELPTGDDETDETAKLLESLRMAEELNVSSSLRLIFPAKTLKLSPAEGNIFTDVVRDRLESPLSAEDKAGHPSGRPHDVSPNSTHESEHLAEPDDCRHCRDPILPPPALRKRDTMIRELKMRLREKFQCVGDDASTPTIRLSPIPTMAEGGIDPARFPVISKKKTKVMSKLESILSSFNALAQMKGEGRVYRTVDHPISYAAEYYTNDVDYESPASIGNAEETNFHSTGYPHHLLQQSMVFQKAASMMSEPTIYDPSLPDDIPLHYPDVPHPMEPLDVQFHHHQQKMLARSLEDHYMLGLDPRLRDFYDNTLFEQQMESHAPHEGLYNVANSLEQGPLHVARKGRNPPPLKRNRSSRRKKDKDKDTTEEDTEEEVLIDADRSPTWSETDSQLFADQKAADHYSITAGTFHPSNMTHSRISPYNDRWHIWEQLNHGRLSEEDRRRWEEERSRRMLLWVQHTSQTSPSCAVPGSQLPLPHWWQAGERIKYVKNYIELYTACPSQLAVFVTAGACWRTHGTAPGGRLTNINLGIIYVTTGRQLEHENCRPK